MNTVSMDKWCAKCGGEMKKGLVTAQGLAGGTLPEGKSRLLFLLPVPLTIPSRSAGPAEPAYHGFRISGLRCSRCGFVELYADEQTTI